MNLSVVIVALEGNLDKSNWPLQVELLDTKGTPKKPKQTLSHLNIILKVLVKDFVNMLVTLLKHAYKRQTRHPVDDYDFRRPKCEFCLPWVPDTRTVL